MPGHLLLVKAFLFLRSDSFLSMKLPNDVTLSSHYRDEHVTQVDQQISLSVSFYILKLSELGQREGKIFKLVFHGGSHGKESACNVGDLSTIPRSGR